MEIKKLVVGQLETNCYLVWDKENLEAIIIDPGDAADYIDRQIRDLELVPKLIVATHGHFDHILAANQLKIAYQIPLLLHQNDLFLVERMERSARYWLGENLYLDPPPSVDRFIKEGEAVNFGKESLKVIESPGHTPGGVALYAEGVLFSGDTIFYHALGRTDFSYASAKDLKESISKLLSYPSETVVYPGHGLETTIEVEKKFLRE